MLSLGFSGHFPGSDGSDRRGTPLAKHCSILYLNVYHSYIFLRFLFFITVATGEMAKEPNIYILLVRRAETLGF